MFRFAARFDMDHGRRDYRKRTSKLRSTAEWLFSARRRRRTQSSPMSLRQEQNPISPPTRLLSLTFGPQITPQVLSFELLRRRADKGQRDRTASVLRER